MESGKCCAIALTIPLPQRSGEERMAMRASLGICVLWSLSMALLAASGCAFGMDLQPVGSVVGLPPYLVAVEGDYAYCAAHRLEEFENHAFRPANSALEIYDIGDPARPRIVGLLAVEGLIADLVVNGGIAYLAGAGDWLRVVDVSDPAAPTEVRVIEGTGDAICLSGPYLYTAHVDTGVHIFDISSPTEPVEVGCFPMLVHGIAVVGELAYVTGGNDLLVLDVSDKEHPAEVGRLEQWNGWGSQIRVSGDHAFVVGEWGLTVADISDPSAPALAVQCSLPPGSTGADFAVWGGYAYVPTSKGGATVVDISSPTEPTIAGSCSTPGHTYGIAVTEGHAYAADYEGGLRVFDLSDPGNPREVAGTGSLAFVRSLTCANGRLFGASWHDYQLVAADISEPAAPRVVSGVCDGGASFGYTVAAVGDYVYLGTVGTSSGTFIFDVSDSDARPLLCGDLTELGETFALAVRGDRMYLGDGWRLAVVDISNPAGPTVLGIVEWVNGSCDAAVNESGTHVLLASGVYGLRVVDVSDPRRPAQVALVDTPVWAWGVGVKGDYAYVADWESLRVFYIGDPTCPVEVAVWECENLAAVELEIVGSYLYLADYAYGLRVIGISDPLNPVEGRSCALPAGPETYGVGSQLGASGVAVSGGHVYVADYGWGLYVFELTSSFEDVPVDHWAADAVERCASSDIVSGYGEDEYGPSVTVSRDQMAVFISRSICTPVGEAGLESYVPPGTPSFNDVSAGYWAYRYIEYAAEHSIVAGYEDGTYDPEGGLDRGQMAVFIARAMAGGDEGVPEPTGCASFSDIPEDFWARKYVEFIASEGVAGGYDDGLYHPEHLVSRDQMAVFITRGFGLGM
jgi:hypothetical protein